jgi:hypothetical protein
MTTGAHPRAAECRTETSFDPGMLAQRKRIASIFPTRSSLAATDELDIVAIRVEHESGIIVGAVFFTQAGSAIIRAACHQCETIEFIDLGAAIGPESEMDPGHGLLSSVKPYLHGFLAPDADDRRIAVFEFMTQNIADRSECGHIEALGSLEIRDREGNVIEHKKW